ncbi:MAG: Golgi apparatus membrane protein TVP23 A [Tremellales sp. Tagirdzhanova-0007]|nr:MAG: Golgi apparatus membrane protein TVP23 A [Tremellales sp. Tagirdzhanova-0007]
MASHSPLLSGTIEADEDSLPAPTPKGSIGSSAKPQREPVVLVPGTSAGSTRAATLEEGGIVGIWKQSSHPISLGVLYLFRSAAITVYVLCGLFTDNYVLSIVVVVVLLSLDFWNTRNVAGRTLVGLRYWNEIDEEGESSWVFESRDIALYAYPLGWLAVFIVSLLRFSVSFLPIVFLALVFNLSNLLGFTYADRDAQRHWASSVAASGNLLGFGFGGIGAGSRDYITFGVPLASGPIPGRDQSKVLPEADEVRFTSQALAVVRKDMDALDFIARDDGVPGPAWARGSLNERRKLVAHVENASDLRNQANHQIEYSMIHGLLFRDSGPGPRHRIDVACAAILVGARPETNEAEVRRRLLELIL